MSYRIVRHYQLGGKRVIKSDLTLEEVRNHCSDPQTSSKTATGKDAYTRRVGDWFDGYELTPVKNLRRKSWNRKFKSWVL